VSERELMAEAVIAFLSGLVDGLEQPDELSTGMTYADDVVQESYDAGTIVGQKYARKVREKDGKAE
jgi:hypothetical protein